MTPTPGFRLAIRDLAPSGSQAYPSDRWTVTVGTALTSNPATKLQNNDLLNDTWTAYNQRNSSTWVQGQTDGAALNLAIVALLGLNRRAPSALLPSTLYTANTARLRVDSYPISSRIRPALTVSSKTNLTGTDANFTTGPIDPPDDPSPSGYAETKLTPTNPAIATAIVVASTNFYATERPLSGTQTLRVHLRDVNNPSQVPNPVVTIYQLGVLKLTLSSPTYERVTVSNSSGGFILTYTFSPATLSTNPIQVHVDCALAADHIGIELLLSLSGYLYDSGSVAWNTGTDVDNLVFRPDLALSAGTTYYAFLDLSDFCSYTTANYTRTDGASVSATTYASIVAPGESSGRLEAGRFVGSDAVVFPISGVGGYNLRTTGDSQPERTRSGSVRSSRSGSEWQECDLSVVGVSSALHQKLERLFRSLGMMKVPTLLYPDPDFTGGAVTFETAPRWVVLSGKEESHVGRWTGIDPDTLSDNLVHTLDRWDMVLHFVDAHGVRSGA